MKTVQRWVLSFLSAVLVSAGAIAEDKPAKVALDWATYNPVGMVLKAKGWLEEDLGQDGIAVEWTRSVGGNQSIGLINSGKIHFASTAGSAALVGKLDGAQIKAIYAFSQPEWAALVVPANSPIRTVADLKGKRIAAARGTDPHLLLVRALADHGVSLNDVNIVIMSHTNGKPAMDGGSVDAWAGLDPMMAQAELDGSGRLLFRAAHYNTYGLLNVSTSFAKAHPATVRRVLAAYEKARLWSIEHPGDVIAMLAEASEMPKPVIARQMERTDLSQPVIGTPQRDALIAAGNVLHTLGLVPESVKVTDEVDALIDVSFLPQLAKR